MRVAHGQVKDHRAGHDGHVTHAHVHARLMLLQKLHHARGRGQPERAAARQHHGVGALHGIFRRAQVRLARAGRRAAHVRTHHRAVMAGQNHGHAGFGGGVLRLPHADAMYIGNAAFKRRLFHLFKTSLCFNAPSHGAALPRTGTSNIPSARARTRPR